MESGNNNALRNGGMSPRGAGLPTPSWLTSAAIETDFAIRNKIYKFVKSKLNKNKKKKASRNMRIRIKLGRMGWLY